jgi:uncharacterized SAM-binding protein YcdF (DUF218 family)
MLFLDMAKPVRESLWGRVRSAYSQFLGHIMELLGVMVLGMTLGALILAYVSAGDIYDYQDTVDGANLPEIDVIVCVGGGRGRIAASGDVWYRYWEEAQRSGTHGTPKKKAPVLYISGMGHQAGWAAFAKQLRPGVLKAIQTDHVVLETESENTEENARWLGRYAKQRGWNKILLITSRYHMKRARFIFDRLLRRAGHPLDLETLSVYQEPLEPDEWHSGLHGIRVTLTEYLKWVYTKSFWTPDPAGLLPPAPLGPGSAP